MGTGVTDLRFRSQMQTEIQTVEVCWGWGGVRKTEERQDLGWGRETVRWSLSGMSWPQ